MRRIAVQEYREGDIWKVTGYTEPVKQLEDIFLQGDSCTGIAEDGEYIFCTGLTFYWPGHAEAWAYFTRDVHRYIRSFQAIRDLLKDRIEKHNLYRVSAHCRVDSPESCRFLEHLGFMREGYLRKWGPEKADYYLYGLIGEEA